MRYGRLKSSPRLQRALKALQDAQGELSTMQWAQAAKICAVSSVAAELRANGAQISCRQATEDGQRRWYYTLLKSPEGQQ
ncbi:hypothetical protein [uncultured Tateyamaria sp.]|uniref:hypothetical protein n=1 Tax=uncultured Tateyamaria sp. TaxID=455651 RepID=UPI00260683E1|nr:hypothetical protein [uncultured Tateyamaria sp.]